MTMELATETGRLVVEKRRDVLVDYRKLLSRWVVGAGRDNKHLARLTLRVLDGEDYGAALTKVS